jgi:hypothetical protein
VLKHSVQLQYTSGVRDENDSASEYSDESYDSYEYYEESDPDADDDAETMVQSEESPAVIDHAEFPEQTNVNLPDNNDN